MRKIDDILHFRSDISPFLVHLTHKNNNSPAEDVLKKIISERQLVAGTTEVSDARFGMYTSDMGKEKRRYFGAICFTETPINEIHSFARH